jgi:hypothetical protein
MKGNQRLYEKCQRAKAKHRVCYDTDEPFRGLEADLACARALKLDKYTDQLFERRNTAKFPCLLHKRGPWARLYRADSGDILYKCPHHGGYTLTLPQVRASIAYAKVTGKAVNILHDHNAEHMVWRLLLLWEAVAIELKHVPHRLLPDYVRMDTANVYAGFLRLLALKWHVDEWYGNGTTFGWDFAAAWCRTTKDRVRRAMKWLLGSGFIYTIDHVKARFGKKMAVFLPVGATVPR